MKIANKQNGFLIHPNARGGSLNTNFEAKKRLSEENASKNPRSISIKRTPVVGLLGKLPKDKADRKVIKGAKIKGPQIKGQKGAVKSNQTLDDKENRNEMNTRYNHVKGSDNSKDYSHARQELQNQLSSNQGLKADDFDDVHEAERMARQYFQNHSNNNDSEKNYEESIQRQTNDHNDNTRNGAVLHDNSRKDNQIENKSNLQASRMMGGNSADPTGTTVRGYLKRELYGDTDAIEKRKKQLEFQNSLKAQLELKQKRLLEEKQRQEQLRKLEEERIEKDMHKIEIRNSFMKVSATHRAQGEYEHPFHVQDLKGLANKSKVVRDGEKQVRFNVSSNMQKSHFYEQDDQGQFQKTNLVDQKSTQNTPTTFLLKKASNSQNSLPVITTPNDGQTFDKQLLLVISEALKAYCQGSAKKNDHDEKVLPTIENKRIIKKTSKQMTPPVVSKQNDQVQIQDFSTAPAPSKKGFKNKFIVRDRQMPVLNSIVHSRIEKENISSFNVHNDAQPIKTNNHSNNVLIRQHQSVPKRTYLINSKVSSNEEGKENTIDPSEHLRQNSNKTIEKQGSYTDLVLITSPKDVIKHKDYLHNTSQLSSGRSNKPFAQPSNEGVHIDEFKHVDAQHESPSKKNGDQSELNLGSMNAKKQFYDTYLQSIHPAETTHDNAEVSKEQPQIQKSLANYELELKTSTKFVDFPLSKVFATEKNMMSKEKLSAEDKNLSSTQQMSTTNFDISQKLQSYQVFMRARLAHIFGTIESSEIKDKIKRIVCNSGDLNC